MSALRETLPDQSEQPKKRTTTRRKTLKPNAPDLTVAPRALSEIDAPFRGGDNWTAIPRSYDSDRVRLASGSTFWALTTYITHLSGRDRKAGEKLSFEAEISIPEAALWCRCNERSIDRELMYLCQRDMAIVSRLAGRKVVVRLIVWQESSGDKEYPGWANIPQCYAEWAAAQRQSLDEQLAEKEQEEANPVLRLKKTRVKPGHQSDPQSLNTHIENWRVKCAKDSPLDIELSGKVVSGELVLSVSGVAQEALRSKRDAKAVDSTSSDVSSRHPCLENAKIPANVGIGNTPTKSPQMRVHERAEEISGLFDGPILKWSGKSLSNDPKILAAACDALESVPHDFLVRQIADRASRQLKLSHVDAFCKEVAANWRKLESSRPRPMPSTADGEDPGWMKREAAKRRKR